MGDCPSTTGWTRRCGLSNLCCGGVTERALQGHPQLRFCPSPPWPTFPFFFLRRLYYIFYDLSWDAAIQISIYFIIHIHSMSAHGLSAEPHPHPTMPPPHPCCVPQYSPPQPGHTAGLLLYIQSRGLCRKRSVGCLTVLLIHESNHRWGSRAEHLYRTGLTRAVAPTSQLPQPLYCTIIRKTAFQAGMLQAGCCGCWHHTRYSVPKSQCIVLPQELHLNCAGKTL